MIGGNPRFTVIRYTYLDELLTRLDALIGL